MRKARTALALLLAFAIPIRAETTTDPLWYLLSTYVLAPDTTAAQTESEDSTDAKGLAELQSDLLLLSEGFESFRDESQVKETLTRLEPRMSPELRPFFKDRASSLDAIYRTLAVTDYTWAQRFPEPPCSPVEARRKLLDSRDGLFQTAKGDASPWLVSMLGPRAEGKSVEQALDQASAKTKLTAAEYEKRRAQIRRLTLALASDKAVGSARSKLYCSRAAAYEDLAASHRLQGVGATLASRSAVRAAPEPSVFVVVWNSRRAAATLVGTKAGPVLLTDAAIVQDTDHPFLFAYSDKAKPLELKATVARRDAGVGLAILTFSEDRGRPALTLAETVPSENDLVSALGHTEVSGLWTKSSGLVTRSGSESFQTDAAISSDFSGGPVLNEAGEVAGILVLRPADTEEGRWPIAVPAAVIGRWLDGSESAGPTATESIEDAGTAAILSRTRPSALTEAGLGDWNIPNLPPPPPTPRGVCVANCGGSGTPSRSYSSYSGGSSNSGNAELGQALGKLGAVLILEGIPALFRGIGKLFKGSGKRSSPSRVATHETSPKAEPPPKPKPPPLKPIGIRLTVDKSEALPRDIVRLTAKVLFTGVAGSKAGIAVSFSKK
ncbi:MAG: serine protease [Elusimicrobia bacterium]|nr:serine protease [Elusimicrobiota bacterium]